jgi:aquaporin Z
MKPNTADFHLGQAFVGEMVVTAALAMTVTTQGELKMSGLVGPIAIGTTVYWGAQAIGPISGGAFNPAIGMG